jgi:hypothetical protein
VRICDQKITNLNKRKKDGRKEEKRRQEGEWVDEEGKTETETRREGAREHT